MSYTYPEALAALESIAREYLKVFRPNSNALVYVTCDPMTPTACVRWDSTTVKIFLPVRPASAVMTQEEFEDWVAYVLHEMGHPTYTDLKTWELSCARGLSRMVNALEDVRMELAEIKSGIVPNAKRVLSRLVARKVAEARAGGKWRPNSRRDFAWTVCVLGRAANGYDIDAGDLAWIRGQINPASTVGKLLVWVLPDLAKCADTADCLHLAERIAKVLKAAAQPADAPEGAKVNPSRSNGEASQEAPQGQGEGQSEGQGDSQGKGGKGHGNGAVDTGAGDEAPVRSEDDMGKFELAPEASNTLTGTNAEVEARALHILRNPARENPGEWKRGTSPGTTMQGIAQRASRQRALLARALRANETDDHETGRRSGRLNRGALCRVPAGASNVFAKRMLSEGYDTDVLILIDASGSMGGWPLQTALATGLIVSQAAASVGAPSTTEIFNSRGFTRAGTVGSRRAPQLEEFAGLQDMATGGTPLSTHIARAAKSQAKRAGHKRRVMFVITDGACDMGPAVVKRMVDYAERTYGTVLAHVSIGNPLQGCFKAEIMVPPGKAVADLGLEHFVKVLQAL